jgi:thioredoxin-like negative regulator of GroEL
MKAAELAAFFILSCHERFSGSGKSCGSCCKFENSSYYLADMRNLAFLLAPCVIAAATTAQPTSQTNVKDIVATARQLASEHKFKESFALLKDAIKKNPNCGECYLELAEENLKLRNLDEALSLLDKAIKQADNTSSRATAHRYKGLLLYSGDKKALQKAEAEFREALALDPTQVEARFNLGVTLLRQGSDEAGLSEIRKYLDTPGPKYDLQFAKRILENPRLARETLAPDFNVTTVDGSTLRLSQCSGKIVVIDFWATWCPPCRASVPEIKELVKKYPPEKLVVLSSSADSNEKDWREFIAKKQMTWPQFLDKDGHLAEAFGVHAFPTYIVIDRDGFIRKRLVGMNPQQSIAHQLKEELKSILE